MGDQGFLHRLEAAHTKGDPWAASAGENRRGLASMEALRVSMNAVTVGEYIRRRKRVAGGLLVSGVMDYSEGLGSQEA